jgi:hypothetical protein
MERVWLKTASGEEHEFIFSGRVSYATGQRRILLPDGRYRQFTFLDDPAALDLPVDDIPELFPEELEEVVEKRDSIPIFTNDNEP